MFYVTTTIDGKVTARLLAEATTRAHAEQEVARIERIADYLRTGETLCIVEATTRAGLYALKTIASAPVFTPDLARAAILGSDSVMNRDF